MEKIKPCPFCGGEAEVIYLEKLHSFRPHCKKIGCILWYPIWDIETKEEAIGEWNIRAI